MDDQTEKLKVAREDVRVDVSGDKDGGWMVDVHDGTYWGLYRPEGDDAEAVTKAALDAHCAAHPVEITYPAPEEPIQPGAGVEPQPT